MKHLYTSNKYVCGSFCDFCVTVYRINEKQFENRSLLSAQRPIQEPAGWVETKSI